MRGLLAGFLLLGACGGGGEPSIPKCGDVCLAGEVGPPVAHDTVAPPDTYQGPPGGVYPPQITSVASLDHDLVVHVELHKPAICDLKGPCPGLVLVPGGVRSGTDEFSEGAPLLAKATGNIVLVYNPPGRGEPGKESGGEEDFNGELSQDVLKDVLIYLQKRSDVADDRVGVLSEGFGLSIATGALARFGAKNLDFVGFLIDIEGPVNRCYVTQAPFTVDEANGVVINSDGDGVTSSRCDFDLFDRIKKFPPGAGDGTGKDGPPNSYICHEDSFPIRLAGQGCGVDAWWKTREPRTYLGDMRVNYLRLQFYHDHEQPTRYGSHEAIHWALEGYADKALPYFQLNDLEPDKVPVKPKKDDDWCADICYGIGGGYGTGYGADIYAADGFKAISMKTLIGEVCPKYVKRMVELSKPAPAP